MKRFFALLPIPFLLLAAACLPTPPPELLITRTPQPASTTPSGIPQETTPSSPMPVEIGSRTVVVDEVIRGFLCDDTWRGVIYVDADVEVLPWDDEAIFLRECDLVIEPGTVVYVADHPGEVFYKGCSCHE
jgi:hypothetical protein